MYLSISTTHQPATDLDTDWIVLDCELMPWSAKAQGLLRATYAPVGVSGLHAFNVLEGALAQAAEHLEKDPLLEAITAHAKVRHAAVANYVTAYRRYCWEVNSLEDYKLAPFHIMATEGAVHADKTHLWHMDLIHRMCEADLAILRPTPFKVVQLDDPTSVEAATNWWLELIAKGGEGMVVKPLDFAPARAKQFVQPALKSRGPEYLRIIYGPEYLLPENLTRLRKRGLSRKRGLAQKEFALGIEALERFVRREPLRKVHECVFGVLALESEPVDPRL